MKKKLQVVSILLLCLLFAGCAREQNNVEGRVSSTQAPQSIPYTFESYKELKEWFRHDGEKCPAAFDEVDRWGVEYHNFIYRIFGGKYQLVRPYIGDAHFSQNYEEEISLYIKDPYGLRRPSIEFTSDYGVIKIFYLRNEEIELAKSKNIDGFLEEIAPNYGTLHSLEKINRIEKLRVEEIQLKDRVVEARVAKWKSNGNLRMTFVYDDMLIDLSWWAEYPIDMLEDFHLEVE